MAEGGRLVAASASDGYIRAAFGPASAAGGATADLELLLARDADATVAVRCLWPSQQQGVLAGLLPDQRAERLLERLRLRLGWPEVFVMRNRSNLFGLESPFDSFGPLVPQGGVDYAALDDPLSALGGGE